jgi:hypothetical protein
MVHSILLVNSVGMLMFNKVFQTEFFFQCISNDFSLRILILYTFQGVFNKKNPIKLISFQKSNLKVYQYHVIY